LVVVGEIADIEDRSGRSERTGKDWRMVTCFVPGRRKTHRVVLSDDLIGSVNVGDDVELTVYPEVYQGEVSYRATGHFVAVSAV